MEQEKKSMTMEDLKGVIKDTVKPEITETIENFVKAMTDELDKKIKELSDSVDARIVVGDDLQKEDKKGGFKSLAHFATDVAKAALSSNRSVSETLVKWDSFVTSQQKAAGSPSQNVSDGEAGGYLVPPEFRNELLNAARERLELMGMARVIPMQAQYVEIPYINGFDRSGGLLYGNIEWLWGSEESAYTEKSAKFGNIGLKLNKLTGLAYASDEILKFSPMSMENILRDGFADGLNYQFNKVILKGTGAGQPLGVLNSPCKVSVAKETNQAANTILFENVVNMLAHVNDMSRCVWVANPNILPQLMVMNISVGTGGSAVWLANNSAAGAPLQTLLGRPIIFSHHCKTLGTEGDLLLLDMSQYLVGLPTGSGVEFESTIYFKFDVGQKSYRWTTYADGQPWWPTYITPQEATTFHISPMVTLATRA